MKRIFLACLGISLLFGVPLRAANIAWVSYHSADDSPDANAAAAGFTNAPDVGYTALLKAHGHTVTRFLTVANLDTYPDVVAGLNSNDLVIVSRSNPSGNFQSAADTAAWAAITKPVLIINGYLLRNSRLGFTTGTTIPDVNSNPMRLKINAPGHPLFAGVGLDSNSLMLNPYSQIVTFTNATTGATNIQRGISVNNNTPVAGGTILAVVGTTGDAAFNGMVIGEFPAGTVAATAAGDVFAEKRLVLLTGSREQTITGDGAGIYDLLPDGEKIFLNAVTYLTTPSAPVCTVPLAGATNLVAGDSWTFAAGPIGTSPLTYQWYKDGQALAGDTDAALALTNLNPISDGGAYYLVVTNSLGSATSTVARLEFAVFAAANITNGLISYWPLDTILGTKTPDLVSGYDMTLVNMGATNLADGKWGKAFTFDNGSQTLLQRINNPGEDLPIYNHPNFSVSLWVNGLPQSDHRIFAEGSTTNTNPIFDLGTDNGGTTGSIDSYIRTDTGSTSGDHRHSTGQAFDGSWHNVIYVQRDVGGGAMKALLYIDGVLDPVVLGPVRPITANTTAIGALLRSSASAWFSGMIDEVAVWDRALSTDEIQVLQITSITNPPSRLQPLAINSFKAELPAVVTGGSTVLHWDVSKDITQVTIDQGIGDVTSKTSVGLGSTSVTLTNGTTFVMTIKRGVDTLSATTSVAVVSGVAPGWALLDSFDLYPPGNLFGTGYWGDPHGNSATVVDLNGNRVLKTSSGDSIAVLNLQSLSVLEGQARTLFFRVIPVGDPTTPITNIVGLTDKSQRSYGDDYANIGPVLYPTALTNDLYGITTNAWYLGVRNGVGAPLEYPAEPVITNVVYNVWIDVTNAPMGDPFYLNDMFTVYIQKEGDTSRTTLYQDYISDRDLSAIDPVLGGMRPNLDKLIVLGNNANQSALFDDFYLSTGGYNATVPRPFGSTAPVTPGSLQIHWSGSQLEILWTAGTLLEADSLAGPWSPVQGAAAPSYKVTPGASRKFYRSIQ